MRTLGQHSVRSRHQLRLLEKSLEEKIVLVALPQPGRERGEGGGQGQEGSVEARDHPAVDRAAVQEDFYLISGHGDSQPVPGVVRQAEGEGLHPGGAGAGAGGLVVNPHHVLPPAGLDLQVPVSLVLAVRKCKESSAVLAFLSD